MLTFVATKFNMIAIWASDAIRKGMIWSRNFIFDYVKYLSNFEFKLSNETTGCEKKSDVFANLSTC